MIAGLTLSAIFVCGIYEKLEDWQTGIGAFLGLFAILFGAMLNAQNNRDLARESHKNDLDQAREMHERDVAREQARIDRDRAALAATIRPEIYNIGFSSIGTRLRTHNQ